KLDLSRAAVRLSATHAARGVKVLSYSGSGIETTFTQGEDACLAAMVPTLPTLPEERKQLLVAGSLPDIVEEQLLRLFHAANIDVAFFPPRATREPPTVGPGTSLLLAQPFLATTAAALVA